MRKTTVFFALLFATCAAFGQVQQTVTINSYDRTAPTLQYYQANEITIPVALKNGTNAANITGLIPFFSWATSTNAGGIVTASCAIVNSTGGTFNATFSRSNLNANGYFIYEAGAATSAGVPVVYRQGTFQLIRSPYAAGVGPAQVSSNIDFSIIGTVNAPWILTNAVDGTTITYIGGVLSAVSSPDYTARSNITTHVADLANPHQVTAAQLGALTNNQTNVTLKGTLSLDATPIISLTPGGGVQNWRISTTDNYLELINLSSSNAFLFGRTGALSVPASGSFSGNGSGITNINGVNIQAGTISTGKLDFAISPASTPTNWATYPASTTINAGTNSAAIGYIYGTNGVTIAGTNGGGGVAIDNEGKVTVTSTNSSGISATVAGRMGVGTNMLSNSNPTLWIYHPSKSVRTRISYDAGQSAGMEFYSGSSFKGGFITTDGSCDFYSPAGFNGVIQMNSLDFFTFNSGTNGAERLRVNLDGVTVKSNLTIGAKLNFSSIPTVPSGSGYVWNSNGFLRIEP